MTTVGYSVVATGVFSEVATTSLLVGGANAAVGDTSPVAVDACEADEVSDADRELADPQAVTKTQSMSAARGR